MNNFQTDTRFTDVRDGAPLTAAQILEVALVTPGEKGATFADMIERAPVITALRAVAVDAVIVLTHEQWALVSRLAHARSWPITDGLTAVALALQEEMEGPKHG